MIEVKNLVKRYGTQVAVDHLNFTLEKGKIYGFLGPNGAGKSTTMNIMTGYLGATEGEVVINGHDILKEPEAAKKCIGYLPELPPLYTDMKVEEYLHFAAELKKIAKKDREGQIGRVMELTKLGDVRHRLIRNLSKGYRQRVGLAQAILGFPEIIILDEPTVGLDPKQIIEIRELIRELAKDHTVILSSHILAEISAVCDYILIISHGKLVASDTPEHLEMQMKGSERLLIYARGIQSVVEGILSQVPHIADVSYTVLEDGTTKAEILEEEGADIREELFYAFAENRCPLLEMTKTKATLENVFLELTQSEEQEAPVSEQTEESVESEEEADESDL
ncbi:MAG TPA: ABC transporter [Lachnospiraceae bacterium]|nr:ABC transporter [Lachnospiraceae bacterium]